MSDMVKGFGMAMDAIDRRRTGRPAPMATCPECGEPLIATFRFPGKEFVCMGCKKLWEFLDPVPEEVTPELTERYGEMKKRWEIWLKANPQPGRKDDE